MSTVRRVCVVLLAFGLLGSLALWHSVEPQAHAQGKMDPKAKQPPKLSAPIGITVEPGLQRTMERVWGLCRDENWDAAVKDIQTLLDRKEDGYVYRMTKAGAHTDDAVSIRFEVNRLLGQMPAEGLKRYEDWSGQFADSLVTEALKADTLMDRRQLLMRTVQKYLHTKNGAKAVELLATDLLERGKYSDAALYFKLRMDLPNSEPLSSQARLKSLLAFSRTHDQRINRQELMRELLARADREGGIKLGTSLTIPKDKIEEELNRNFVATVLNSSEVPIFRGDPSRIAQGLGGAPDLTPSWQVSMLPEKEQVWITDQIKKGTDFLGTRSWPAMPAFFPVAANGKLIFRTYSGIYVVNLREPRFVPDRDDPNKLVKNDAREAWNYTDGGAEAILSEPNKKGALDQWKQQFSQSGPHSLIFENSVVGTVTTDGLRAYVVDDLMLPPPNTMRFNGMKAPVGGLGDQATRNTLKVYNLESMKLVWELGGKQPTGNKELDDLVAGSFFLGAPLPMAGKLYLLNEKNGELRLLCVEPRDRDERTPPPPELVWVQKLVSTRDSIGDDFNRRIHAAHIAYGEGMLVCPTNAGALLGVDQLTRSLVWIHRYREGAREQPVNPNPFGQPGFGPDGRPLPNNSLLNEWKEAAPAIVDGKVLFTSWDSNALHCLRLRDGELLWRVTRGTEDIYFAGVFDGKAIVVGKNHIRAFHINNEASKEPKEAWTIVNTGMPTGQGVASDNIYYLPVKKGTKPEIVAIDIARGVIQAPVPVQSNKPNGQPQEVGNLIFYEGQLISQTADSVISYPQVLARMAEIDARLKKDPRDLRALAERGELLLGKGDHRGAIQDLHLALEILTPNPATEELKGIRTRVRGKLYETLSLLMDRDFTAAERHLPEYEDLCKSDDPKEQFQRQTNFLSRLARGREQQGRLTDAFDAYMKFGALVGDRKLINVSDQPNTEARPDVWARGRIGAMMAKANAEQRKPLEERIAQRWQALRDGDDLKALEDFVALFGSAFEAGKEAKLKLALRLLADNMAAKMPEAQLKAQMLLLQLRELRDQDPKLAAQAVDALAQMMERKGEMAHAISYKKELGRDYAKLVIRDGKTGADFLNEVTTDKRYLPYLEPPRATWKGSLSGKKVPGNSAVITTFTVDPVGDVLPFFQKHRLALEYRGAGNLTLRFIDRTTGDPYWQSPPLVGGDTLFNNQATFDRFGRQVSTPNLRFTYQARGHMVLIQIAHMIYALDPIEKRKLWDYNLYEPGTGTNPTAGSVVREDGRYFLLFQDGFKQRLGQPGPLESNYVCLQTRKGLVAFDPVIGPSAMLWTKTDVSPRTEIFGDDQYIFLVDINSEGRPTSARKAVRGSDGVTVDVPEFVELYRKEKRLSIRGRLLVVKDESAKGEPMVRVYDCQSGKDVWTKTFPVKSTLLDSEDTDLVGAVDPDGNLLVVDTRTQQEVLKTTVKKEDVAKLTAAHLLADREQIYVVFNQEGKAIEGLNGELQRNVAIGMGTVDVNGQVYAFDRATGKTRWANAVANQKLVLEQFGDMPMLLFTVKYMKQDRNFGVRWYQALDVIDKSTGKFVWPPPAEKEMATNNNNQLVFFSVHVNPRGNFIELVQQSLKMRFDLQVE